MRLHYVRTTSLIWISLLGLSLTGCASTSLSGTMPQGQVTMRHMYKEALGSSTDSSTSLKAYTPYAQEQSNPAVYEPISSTVRTDPFSRNFRYLNNPMMHVYVYPHLATGMQVPVPGYSTVFPLYSAGEFVSNT